MDFLSPLPETSISFSFSFNFSSLNNHQQPTRKVQEWWCLGPLPLPKNLTLNLRRTFCPKFSAVYNRRRDMQVHDAIRSIALTPSLSLYLSIISCFHTKYLSLTLHYLMHPIVLKLVWSWFLSLDSPAMTNLVLPDWFSRKPQLQTLRGQSDILLGQRFQNPPGNCASHPRGLHCCLLFPESSVTY